MGDLKPYCVLIQPNNTDPTKYQLELRPITEGEHPEPCEKYHAGISTQTLTRFGVLVDGKIIGPFASNMADSAAREMLMARGIQP